MFSIPSPNKTLNRSGFCILFQIWNVHELIWPLNQSILVTFNDFTSSLSSPILPSSVLHLLPILGQKVQNLAFTPLKKLTLRCHVDFAKSTDMFFPCICLPHGLINQSYNNGIQTKPFPVEGKGLCFERAVHNGLGIWCSFLSKQ